MLQANQNYVQLISCDMLDFSFKLFLFGSAFCVLDKALEAHTQADSQRGPEPCAVALGLHKFPRY